MGKRLDSTENKLAVALCGILSIAGHDALIHHRLNTLTERRNAIVRSLENRAHMGVYSVSKDAQNLNMWGESFATSSVSPESWEVYQNLKGKYYDLVHRLMDSDPDLQQTEESIDSWSSRLLIYRNREI